MSTKSRLAAIFLALLPTLPAFSQVSFIAGLEPSKRPPGAPSVTTVDKSGVQHINALHGIEQPVTQDVLGIVETQGNWYTPFNKPGMVAPYDLRGWYSQINAAPKSRANRVK